MTLDARFYFPIEIYAEQSNEIEGIYDNKVANNDYVTAWHELVDTLNNFEDPINPEVIKKAQERITWHQTDLERKFKGDYRTVGAWVGGRAGVQHELVEDYMNNWFLDHAVPEDPLEAHVRFEKIHPFADGNGRTGRIIYWYQCLQQNKMPILFTSERRFDYYKLFH